jgi:hypothetical protein
MNYQSVVQMFLQTDANQWERVSSNHEYAFCKEDINLRIVSSLEADDIQQDDFREPWANNFPDPRARGYFYIFTTGPRCCTASFWCQLMALAHPFRFLKSAPRM